MSGREEFVSLLCGSKWHRRHTHIHTHTVRLWMDGTLNAQEGQKERWDANRKEGRKEGNVRAARMGRQKGGRKEGRARLGCY